MKNFLLFTLLLSLCCAPLLQAQDFEYLSKNRVGLELNQAFGFQSIPMILYEGGKSSDMKFGECTGFGINYGHQFTKHFDLSSAFGYYWSSLTPKSKDGSAVFSSLRFSLTPAFVIPLGDGGRSRVRVGAGLDLCFSNQLDIEMSTIKNGGNDTWDYDRAIGYHFNALYESSFSNDKWSSFLGVQYYGIEYNFASGSSLQPTDLRLKSPSGNGIGLIFGVNYCF